MRGVEGERDIEAMAGAQRTMNPEHVRSAEQPLVAVQRLATWWCHDRSYPQARSYQQTFYFAWSACLPGPAAGLASPPCHDMTSASGFADD